MMHQIYKLLNKQNNKIKVKNQKTMIKKIKNKMMIK